MMQKYVVFRNEKKIILAEDINTGSQYLTATVIHYSKDILSEAYRKFISGEYEGDLVIVAGSHIEKAFRDFTRLFHFINAAGGIVKKQETALLFIRRWDKWDLPKGKLKKTELPETGALREVMEETGLQHLLIKSFAGFTYHIYSSQKRGEILKRTYWYHMETLSDEPLIPQKEEDITEVRWFLLGEIPAAINDSYSSIRFLFEQMND